MTGTPDARQVAEKLIRDRAQDVEFLTVHENLPEELPEEAADILANEVADLIGKATVIVAWPDKPADADGITDHTCGSCGTGVQVELPRALVRLRRGPLPRVQGMVRAMTGPYSARDIAARIIRKHEWLSSEIELADSFPDGLDDDEHERLVDEVVRVINEATVIVRWLPDPANATAVLREPYTAAIRERFGDWDPRGVATETFLAVRDEELERLRTELATIRRQVTFEIGADFEDASMMTEDYWRGRLLKAEAEALLKAEADAKRLRREVAGLREARDDFASKETDAELRQLAAEDEIASLRAELTAKEAVVRKQVAAEIVGEMSMTNAEMEALRDIVDDEYHEQCGPVWLGYASRIVRAQGSPDDRRG